MYVWEFLYSSYGGGYVSLSLHKTKLGAQNALKKHKAKEVKEFKTYISALRQELPKSSWKTLSKFSDHRDWQIKKTKVHE